jgi:hypothetical protein
MRIICFEGPSAVGKTSTAAAMAEAVGACVIPEVNVLFERPAAERPEWYFERQVDRWRLAESEAQTHPLVVLDGDPYQPLWYTWAYDFKGWQGLDFMQAFYRPRIAEGALGFPHRYIILGATIEELRRRKEVDTSRRRGGFETHLRFIEPQRRYFRMMQAFAPGLVHFSESRSTEENVQVATRPDGSPLSRERALALFDFLVGWLRSHRAT